MENEANPSPLNKKSLDLSQPLPLDNDLYVYADLSSVPDDLLCGVCFRPFVDAVEHQLIGSGGCSQLYCKKCVQSQKLCPHCRNEVNWQPVAVGPSTQRLLFKPLNELKVMCPVCSQKCPRFDLQNHIPQCAVDCPLGCGEKIPPKSQAIHEDVCSKKIISCPAVEVMCPYKGPREQVSEHAEKCSYAQLYPLLITLVNDLRDSKRMIGELQSRIDRVYSSLPIKCKYCKQFYNPNDNSNCNGHTEKQVCYCTAHAIFLDEEDMSNHKRQYRHCKFEFIHRCCGVKDGKMCYDPHKHAL